MDLLEEIKSSLGKQCIEQGNTLYPSSERDYINLSLDWSETIEGHLFWDILNWSWYWHGIYDYVTIIKLYHTYGKDVFKLSISVYSLYFEYFNIPDKRLSDDGFENLCNLIEINGISKLH